MHRTILISAAALSALAMAACSRQEAANNEANPGQTAPVNAAQDAVGAAVGQASATMSANTAGGFVTAAATSDMYEIQAGQIAQQKGQSAGVKAFGKQMVTDHTAMSNQLKPLADKAGAAIPVELDQRRKGMIDNLTTASAADFDRVYLEQQESAHSEALTLVKGYADGGENADLKAFAQKGLPKVQAHLDHVKKLKGEAAAPAKK